MVKRTSSFYRIKATEGQQVRYKIASRNPQSFPVMSFIKGGTTAFYPLKTSDKQFKKYRITANTNECKQRFNVTARILHGDYRRYPITAKESKVSYRLKSKVAIKERYGVTARIVRGNHNQFPIIAKETKTQYRVFSKVSETQRYPIVAPVKRGASAHYPIAATEHNFIRYPIVSSDKSKCYPIKAIAYDGNSLHVPIKATRQNIISYPVFAKKRASISYPIASTSYDDAIILDDDELDLALIVREQRVVINNVDTSTLEDEKTLNVTNADSAILRRPFMADINDIVVTNALDKHVNVNEMNITQFANEFKTIPEMFEIVKSRDPLNIAIADITNVKVGRDYEMSLQTVDATSGDVPMHLQVDDMQIVQSSTRHATVVEKTLNTSLQNAFKVQKADVSHAQTQQILNADVSRFNKASHVSNIYKVKETELVAGVLLVGKVTIETLEVSTINCSYSIATHKINDAAPARAEQKTSIATFVLTEQATAYNVIKERFGAAENAQQLKAKTIDYDKALMNNIFAVSKAQYDSAETSSKRLDTTLQIFDTTTNKNAHKTAITDTSRAIRKKQLLDAQIEQKQTAAVEVRKIDVTVEKVDTAKNVEKEITASVEVVGSGELKNKIVTTLQKTHIAARAKEIDVSIAEVRNAVDEKRVFSTSKESVDATITLAGNVTVDDVDATSITRITNVDVSDTTSAERAQNTVIDIVGVNVVSECRTPQRVGMAEIHAIANVQRRRVTTTDVDSGYIERMYKVTMIDVENGFIERSLNTSITDTELAADKERIFKSSIERNEDGVIERAYNVSIADTELSTRKKQRLDTHIEDVETATRENRYKTTIEKPDIALPYNTYATQITAHDVLTRIPQALPVTIDDFVMGTSHEREKERIWLHMGRSSWLQGWKHWKTR